MAIEHHSFDRGDAQRLLGTYAQSIEWTLGVIETRIDLLPSLVTSAWARAGLLSLVEPESPDLPRCVRLISEAGAALFALARAEKGPVEVPIGGKKAVLTGTVHESHVHVGRWLLCAWAALATDDWMSQALLAATPGTLVAASSSRGDPYLFDMQRALSAFITRDPGAEALLLSALRGTEPGNPHVVPVDRILNLDVPAIEVFFAYLDREADAFNAAIEKAVRLHASYWSAPSRASEPSGLVSVPLTALAHLGLRMGWALGVQSAYVPAHLVRAQDTGALLLCPYCCTPMLADSARCPACLEDPRNDAPIETSAAEYDSAHRKRCSACQLSILDLAVRCPRCRARQ